MNLLRTLLLLATTGVLAFTQVRNPAPLLIDGHVHFTNRVYWEVPEARSRISTLANIPKLSKPFGAANSRHQVCLGKTGCECSMLRKSL